MPISGREINTIKVSFQEIESIIAKTPITVSTAVSTPDRACWNTVVMLSMSLVTREIRSPRWTLSK